MRLRVGTWNVDHAQRDGDKISVTLLERRADIWVLTETRTDLSPGANYRGVFSEPIATSILASAKAEDCWTAIWIARGNFRVRKQPTHAKWSVCAKITCPKITVLIYGVVLPWTALGAGQSKLAIQNVANDLTRLRRRHPAASIILAGDWNQDLRGARFFGSKSGELQLGRTLRRFGLTCRTQWPAATRLGFPLIDHVAAPISCKSRLRHAWPSSWEKAATRAGVVVAVNV